MNIKKIALGVATVLCLTSLAACTSTSKKISFGEYWKYSHNSPNAVNETLTYSVEFEAGSNHAALGYTLNYGAGSYVTTLSCPQSKDEYVYTTSFTIPVTYKYGADEKTFNDSVTTEVHFVGAGMTPTYSKKIVKSHTPINGQPASVSGCFEFFDYVIETKYDKKGESTVTVNPDSEAPEIKKSTFEYGKGDYSYLDNELLVFGLRAMTKDTSSGTVEVFNPFIKQTQRINLSFAAETGAEFPDVTKNGTKGLGNVKYREVTIKLDDKNPGTTQTAKIAAADDPIANANRNVMLSLETPLAYSIGSLHYTLVSIQNN